MWKYLTDHNVQVAALQETHLKKSEEHRLKHKAYPLIYRSSHANKHNGVALIFHTGVPFQMHDTKADKRGRYIMVKGELRGKQCTFADFLLAFLTTPSDFAGGDILIFDDFNLIWDPELILPTPIGR